MVHIKFPRRKRYRKLILCSIRNNINIVSLKIPLCLNEIVWKKNTKRDEFHNWIYYFIHKCSSACCTKQQNMFPWIHHIISSEPSFFCFYTNYKKKSLCASGKKREKSTENYLMSQLTYKLLTWKKRRSHISQMGNAMK